MSGMYVRHARLPLLRLVAVLGCVLPAMPAAAQSARPPKFQLQEASITEIHKAIRRGRITCAQLMQGFLKRAMAYNGVCTKLVTVDGAPVPTVGGMVRAGKPLTFPTDTVPASAIFPNLDQYMGLPLEYGRMEPTVSDPTVWQQQGMRVGIPNAGQLNALETLNLRGERSVSCKGPCDAPPSSPLPADCPATCETFRAQPDALERAAALDAQYKNKPPLDELPMYCIPVVFKDPYDTKDMRSTSNNDVAFAMDAPPFDSSLAAAFRKRGAIVYAKASAHEFNAGPGNPGGPATATKSFPSGVQALSSWSGQACNPYDTEREPRGSSSGPGVAVGANLATVAICEQTFASCQGPASKNNIVNLLPTSGILPDAGGTGNQFFIDRPGIYGKTVKDTAIVLDALKDPDRGYFDPMSIYTASPKALIPAAPYVSFVIEPGDVKRNGNTLEGTRVALVRDFMVKVSKNDEEISDLINDEAKRVLRDQLGADLVESYDPLYPDDPDVPNMSYTFQDAFAEIIPRLRPELFTRTASGGGLLFAVPGYDVTSYGYLLDLSTGNAPIAANLSLRNLTGGSAPTLTFKFDIERYLRIRGDSKVTDWASWVANAKFRQDASVVAATNWLGISTNIDGGKEDQLALSMVARMAMLKVMYENDIDVFINPEITTPPRKIGGPSDPTVADRSPVSCCGSFTAILQMPQIIVPAGYVRTIYEPQFALSSAKTSYLNLAGTAPSTLVHPMPIGLMLWAAPGDEPALITVASAYEAATQHRVPPPQFGPVPGEP